MTVDGDLAAAAGTLTLGGDLEVCRMGFGAMWMTAAHPEPCRAVLLRAVELGIDLIDTADVYGNGSSELMVAEALHPYPAGLVIATKGGQTIIEGRPAANGRPEYLREACEASLQRLRLDTIDLYQLHMPDPDVPLEESLGALAELRSEGKIRHIGGSNFFRAVLELSLSAVPLVSVQNQFNLTSRNSEPEVATCEQRGLAFIAYRPLAGGSVAQTEGELARIAEARGATNAQVALAWLLQRSPSMLPIPGTSSIPHLEENVAAARLHLSGEELTGLDAPGAAGAG
jgi:aryl-alcohol dehydrogenase-like predicted oxidoreductase